MKTIIAGSRTITNYFLVKKFIGRVIKQYNVDISEVVSGGAKGVDQLGEKWARSYGVPVVHFYLTNEDWLLFGNRAGIIRNQQMAEYADVLIAIWDGKSKGTKNMIEEMQKLDKPVYLFDNGRFAK